MEELEEKISEVIYKYTKERDNIKITLSSDYFSGRIIISVKPCD